MRGAKERLMQVHEELDRELEQATALPRSSSASRRDREELRYTSNIDDAKRLPPKPSSFDHIIRDSDIRTKKDEISELERKLNELGRKMENIEVSSDEEIEESRTKPKLAFKEQQHSQPNQDTARFLLQANKQREKANKFLYSYPSLEDEEQDEQDEDSEDYAEMQRAIEKRKQQAREQIPKRTVNSRVAIANKISEPTRPDPERKASTELQSVLKPKYSNEKNNRIEKSKTSQQKKSIRDSVTSKKSQEKQQQPQLNRANSKRSIKSNNSNHSNANSLRRSRNSSKERHDRSFDRFSEKQECLHSEEVGLVRDLKRMGNLERQVAHYKRLAKKYKQQIEEYRVMEIELKELRKNFAKSQLIRTQQKKVIETLKSKINK